MSDDTRKFVLEKNTDWGRIIHNLLMHLEALPPGRSWEIDTHPFVKKRSLDQNAYLWGVVYPEILRQGGLAGQLEGWEAQDLHEYLLMEAFGEEVKELQNPNTGKIMKRRVPLRRSSKLKTKEFADYTKFIQRTMAQIGIYVPDPNEPLPESNT